MKTFEGWGKCSNCGLNADGWWQVDEAGNGSYFCSQGCKQTTKDSVDAENDIERADEVQVPEYTGQLF